MTLLEATVVPRTVSGTAGATPAWVRRHVIRTIAAAAAARVLGDTGNVGITAVRFEGDQDVPSGSPMAASGNVAGGARLERRGAWARAARVDGCSTWVGGSRLDERAQ